MPLRFNISNTSATQASTGGVIAILCLPALAIQVAGSSAAELLRYDREAILAGQLWRLISGHWVHLGWTHLALNLAGLMLLLVGFGGLGRLPFRQMLFATAGLMVGISIGLLVGNPELEWYVGLSGVLHGLAVLIAVWCLELGTRVVLVVGLLLKVGWEQIAGTGSVFGLELGGAVIFDAHLYGVISAGIILAVGYAYSRLSAARTPE